MEVRRDERVLKGGGDRLYTAWWLHNHKLLHPSKERERRKAGSEDRGSWERTSKRQHLEGVICSPGPFVLLSAPAVCSRQAMCDQLIHLYRGSPLSPRGKLPPVIHLCPPGIHHI